MILRSGTSLLSWSARAAVRSENRGNCLMCHEDTHSLIQCRHPFRNRSGIFLNPDLGTLGDDDEAYRRWQERMIRPRRKNRSSRSNKQNNPKQTKAPLRPLTWAAPRPGFTEKNKATATTPARNEVTSSLGLAITVVFHPSPLLLLADPLWCLA